MKVLVCNRLSSRGGEEKHVVDLVRWLSAREDTETWLAAPLENPWSAELAALPRLRRLEARFATKGDLATVLRLFRALRRERFDAVHAHGARAGWLLRLAALLAGYRQVVWSMHLLIRDHVSRQAAWTRGIYAGIERFLNRRTDRIIAVSEDLRRGLLASDPGLDPSRVITVPNGIEDPGRPAPGALDRVLPGRNGSLVCVAVGKLQPEKGHDLLIEAVGRMPETDRPSALIVGEGVERPALEAGIRRLGLESKVKLLGFRPDVPALVAEADVYVMPSRFEGLPIALLEAMALGKAIVAAAVNGIPEAIQDGDNGLLVPREDPEALASALGRLSADAGLRGRLGRRARETWRERFTQETCFGEIRRVYAGLAA